jgi:hypothetical protein
VVHLRPSIGAFVRLSAVALVGVFASGSSCLDLLLDDGEAPPCEAACDLVAFCEFRSQSACEAAMCDPETGEVLAGVRDLDDCLKGTDDCLVAAGCGCDSGCDRIDDCAGERDPTCVETCDTLVEQEPVARYRDNECRLTAESCDDLAVCGSLDG